MQLKREYIKIYAAGKTWHGEKFRQLSKQGYNLSSSWIFAAGQLKDRLDKQPPAHLLNKEQKQLLWDTVTYDCVNSDMMILYSEEEDGDSLSGALVEAGIVIGQNNPVYCVGNCSSLRSNDTSDKAFTYSSLWHWIDETDVAKGFLKATDDYIQRYGVKWHNRQNGIVDPVECPTNSIVEVCKNIANDENFYKKV